MSVHHCIASDFREKMLSLLFLSMMLAVVFRSYLFFTLKKFPSFPSLLSFIS